MPTRAGAFSARHVSLATVAAFALAMPALAGDGFNPLGDGSGFNNLDLVRDETTGCENCLPNPPLEYGAPWFELDWNVLLRGSYVRATGVDYFEGEVLPSVVFHHDFLRGSYDASASADIITSTIEETRLGGAFAGFRGDYRLDESTVLGGAANLSYTQASANAPGNDPNILLEPQVFSGDGAVSVEREFGPTVLTGTLDASRTIYGPTTLIGPVLEDNTDQSNFTAGGALRIGYEITPILTPFIEGSVHHQWYDAPSPVILVKLDATDYELRTGLSGEWNELLEAEASIGYGLRRFDAAILGETSAILYDASVTYRPDETLEIRGAFTTSFDAPGPDSPGASRTEYAAVADVGYVVNPWLRLRAAAGWYYAQFAGSPETERGWNAGLGADYILNEFTTLTGDYTYSWAESTPNPAEDEHRVTVGVTFHD